MSKESNIVEDLKSDWLIDLANFYESLPVPIFVMEPGGRIVYANMAFADLMSFTIDDVYDLELKQLFTSQGFAEVSAMVSEAAKDKEQKNIKINKVTFIGNSGENIIADLDIKSLLYGTDGLIVSTVNDLTEQIRHQEKEKSYQRELDNLSKMADIGRLSSGVAHELNNPLMIIQGFAENLQMMVDSGDFENDELLKSIDPIVRSTDRMAKIISTMMSFVRDEHIVVSQCDLREVATRSIDFVKPMIEEYEVDLEIDFPVDACSVKCDPDQIEQVILNISKNAVHALEKNPVKDRKLKVSIVLEQERFVKIRFLNNGPAIPEEAQEKILKPFFTTKAPGKGTGLGLSLSFEIMKAHGGELKLNHSDESGTEFELTFQKEAEISEIESLEESDTFLIVDDEELISRMLTERIEALGYRVISASDGQEALDIFESGEPIDAIFTDIRMPVKDGFELIRDIRAKNRDIPIFVISGNVSKRSLDVKASHLQINASLEKPINQEDLKELIGTYEKLKSTYKIGA